MLYSTIYNSPLGKLTIASNGKALLGVWFVGQKYFGSEIVSKALEVRPTTLAIFTETTKWLDTYFSSEEPKFTPPIYLASTPFQRATWELLLEIPYGKTRTYKEIANQVASKMNVKQMSAQAVGHAVSCNPISLIIPCHRVIGANGKLTGYAGGIERKAYLLTLEGVSISDWQKI